jgi:hypothetical protein
MIYDVRQRHLPLRLVGGVCAAVVRLGLIDRPDQRVVAALSILHRRRSSDARA